MKLQLGPIVAANYNCVTDDEDKDECVNPQDGDFKFVRDNNYMQAGIADLTACFDQELLRRAATDRGAKSKVTMECGDVFLVGLEDRQDQIFEISAAHAEPQRGVTAKSLSKVWRSPSMKQS